MQSTDADPSKSTTWYVTPGASRPGTVYGDTTHYLWTVWASVLGDEAATVREADVQRLFNALDLYPSKSQVFEMLHCSRQSVVVDDNKSEGKALLLDTTRLNHSWTLTKCLETSCTL